MGHQGIKQRARAAEAGKTSWAGGGQSSRWQLAPSSQSFEFRRRKGSGR